MPSDEPSRGQSVAVAVVGVAFTLLAAVAVVAVGRSGGAGDLVVVPRADVAGSATGTETTGSISESLPYRLEEVARLDMPTALASRPGEEDLYVTQLAGQVVKLEPVPGGGPADFTRVEAPVVDVSDSVSSQPGLEGLASITFSPDGAVLYLAYTDKAQDQVVEAFPAEGDSFGPGRNILTVDSPDGAPTNHIGGAMAFGPDGYLYVGIGDGGAGALQAPDPESLFGKIIRIEPGADGGYTAAPDNTFDGTTGLAEVWTVGMRNPFRIDFDRETGDLWVADVGEESLEEINRLGVDEFFGKDINLGWPQYAGSEEYRIEQPSPTPLPPTPPSYEYSHRQGRCAVIGGEVYRGAEIPDLSGSYLFSDLCSKALIGLGEGADGGYEELTLAATDEAQMVSVDADNAGEIFITSMSGGVYRLVGD